MSSKEHRWVGNGVVKVRGKLYGNGDIIKGLDSKTVKRLMDRGDLEEVKASKEPEKEPEKEAPLSRVKKVVKRVKKKGKK